MIPKARMESACKSDSTRIRSLEKTALVKVWEFDGHMTETFDVARNDDER